MVGKALVPYGNPVGCCIRKMQIEGESPRKGSLLIWRGGRVWLNAPVLKTDEGESPPWVRIPPSPPYAGIAQW